MLAIFNLRVFSGSLVYAWLLLIRMAFILSICHFDKSCFTVANVILSHAAGIRLLSASFELSESIDPYPVYSKFLTDAASDTSLGYLGVASRRHIINISQP